MLQAMDLGRGLAGDLPAEDALLKLLQFLLHGIDDWEVLIDDEIRQRVEHKARPHPQQVGRGLDTRAQARVRRGRPVAHGYDVLFTQEDVRLAEVDAAGGAVELCRAQNDKELVAVHLDLGTLVRKVRILDRQVVQVEGPLHLAQELFLRLVQANPYELAGLIQDIGDVIEIDIANSMPIGICDAVDNGAHGITLPDRTAASERVKVMARSEFTA